jgi:GT2 family glycosyltransferase
VVLATDTLEAIRETLSHLRGQTEAGKLELIVVAPTGAVTLEAPAPELAGFHSVQLVEGDPRVSLAAARAAGVNAATAPVVTFAETHCFPEPRCAEKLIERHRGPWAAVGPEVDSANPDSAIGWAVLLIGYAPWVAPARAGPADHLPGRNSSYKRSVLSDYQDELPLLLDSESILHWDLRARGHRLYLQSAARVRHRSITRLSTATRESFQTGRAFAGLRAKRWTPPRRAAYAVGSPLLPIVRLGRIVAYCLRKGRARVALRALLALVILLLCNAAGELVGYLAGDSDSMRKQLASLELGEDR